MMETELTDTDAISRISQKLQQEDKSLWGRIKDFLKGLVDRLKEAYRKLTPDSRIAATTREAIASSEAILNAYVDAAADAVENYNLQEGQKNNAPEGVRYSQRYIEATENSEIVEMVRNVESGNFKANDKVYFGTVSTKNAAKIRDLTGINVDGFRVAIEARQIEHILKRHGANGAADNSMADVSDIAKMEFTLTDPDNINDAGKTQAYTYMHKGRNRTADTVRYEKNIGERTYYAVQAVPDTKAKTLYIVTAFIRANKKGASQLIDASGSNVNAQSGSVVAPNDTVQQSFAEVKEDLKKSSRNPQKQLEAWETENERLKLEVEYLQKVVQIHKQGNRDYTLDKNSLKSHALDLMKSNNAKGDASELAAIMDELYRYFATDENWQWDELQEKAGKAADWLMEHQKHRLEEYAQSALDWLAKRHVRLNDTQIAEIKYQFGSLSEFKKAVKGTIIIDQQADTQLDQLWQEGAEEYGYLFDETVSDADMPRVFAEVVQGLKDSKSVDQAELEYYREDWRADLTRQILDKFHQVKPVESVSDKAADSAAETRAQGSNRPAESQAESQSR